MSQHPQLEKIQKITDLIGAYQKVTSFKKVERKLKNGKCYKLKRLNLMRGRYYYPATIHRKGPSNIITTKNTAINTFQEDATDAEIYNRMYHVVQREKFSKANAFVSSFMGMAGDSYKRALAKHGLTNENNQFQYDEDEDDEDYVPSDSDTENEEDQQGDEDDDEEQFEEQEQEDDEEQEDDDEEDDDDDEGFEMEDQFEDDDEEDEDSDE